MDLGFYFFLQEDCVVCVAIVEEVSFGFKFTKRFFTVLKTVGRY